MSRHTEHLKKRIAALQQQAQAVTTALRFAELLLQEYEAWDREEPITDTPPDSTVGVE